MALAARGRHIAVVGGCSLDAPRTCGPEGSGDAVDALAATFSAGDYVDGVRTDGAAAFLYEPDPDQSLFVDEAVYVLCVGETAIEAGYTQGPLLSDDRAGVAIRVGTSLSGGGGRMVAEPGWILGRIDDEDVAELEIEWSSGISGAWSVGVAQGFVLVPLPQGAPVDGTLHVRFLSDAGDLIWSQPDD